MGRRAKYFTQAERLAARREQSRKRSQLPSVIASRAKSNHLQYVKRRLKRNCDIEIPAKIRHWASWAITCPNPATFHRFRAYPDEFLMLEESEIGDHELETLSGLPPYPSEVTSLLEFEDDTWDDISGALFGYQVRKLVEHQERQIGQYRSVAIEELSSDIRRELDNHLERWNALFKIRRGLLARGDSAYEVVVSHNLLWLARCALYAFDDLVCIAQDSDRYLATVLDRNYVLGTMTV